VSTRVRQLQQTGRTDAQAWRLLYSNLVRDEELRKEIICRYDSRQSSLKITFAQTSLKITCAQTSLKMTCAQNSLKTYTADQKLQRRNQEGACGAYFGKCKMETKTNVSSRLRCENVSLSGSRRFEGLCCIHLQGSRGPGEITKIQAYILPYLLTPWSRVLPEKLKRSELLKKFPAFYGTRRFITAFTRARHLSLSWANI
jgi:hypothetical protein